MATKEYVAATIIHELVHGYYNETKGRSLYEDAQHNDMAVEYVKPMAEALVGIFSVTAQDAMALSWAGLYGTSAWETLKSLDPAKATTIKLISENYKNGYKGTKCNH
ncbi:hypothetical protein [uncultured Fibrella sp.]|uniref:hypothetical protein n=1 Tax=uncultured Fibrella sp. TaxID=1284596 RepID=UPI0035CAF6DC